VDIGANLWEREEMNRKLILYIAMSLDGFIAKKDDDIDFLSIVETPTEDFGYSIFQRTLTSRFGEEK